MSITVTILIMLDAGDERLYSIVGDVDDDDDHNFVGDYAANGDYDNDDDDDDDDDDDGSDYDDDDDNDDDKLR